MSKFEHDAELNKAPLTLSPKDLPASSSQLIETLILGHDLNSENDTRMKVYDLTLEFLSKNMQNSHTMEFGNNSDLLAFLTDHSITTVITTCAISVETGLLLKGLGVVQLYIGHQETSSKIADIIVDPLVPQSNEHIFGEKFLLSSILSEKYASEIARIYGISVNELMEKVEYHNAEQNLLDVACLFQRLHWDSDFFGVNIGYISCRRLTKNIEANITKFVRKEKLNLLEYLCDCHDKESVLECEKNGYSFVDIRLTFERTISDNIQTPPNTEYGVRKGRESDIPHLKEIATDIYIQSRYYFDQSFDTDKVQLFYLNWVEKAVRGDFDDFAYVLTANDIPIGFCTIKLGRHGTAAISLFGLDKNYGGKGLGKYLLMTSLSKLKLEYDINYIEVVTQGRNYAAQRLYQKCGFVTKSTQLWYHKWFH